MIICAGVWFGSSTIPGSSDLGIQKLPKLCSHGDDSFGFGYRLRLVWSPGSCLSPTHITDASWVTLYIGWRLLQKAQNLPGKKEFLVCYGRVSVGVLTHVSSNSYPATQKRCVIWGKDLRFLNFSSLICKVKILSAHLPGQWFCTRKVLSSWVHFYKMSASFWKERSF